MKCFSRRQVLALLGTASLTPLAKASQNGALSAILGGIPPRNNVIAAGAGRAAPGQGAQPWYENPVTGVGTNIWAPEWYPESITNWDPQKLADSIVHSGANVAFTFQGFSEDHFGISYFPRSWGQCIAISMATITFENIWTPCISGTLRCLVTIRIRIGASGSAIRIGVRSMPMAKRSVLVA